MSAAQQKIYARALQKLVDQGHPRMSVFEIIKRLSYEEQCKLIGQRQGDPYSPY